MQQMFCSAQLLSQFGKGVRIVVVTVDVPQQAGQLAERILIETSVFLQAVFCANFELIEIPARFGHADDRQTESFVTNQSLQRRKYLLVREVAGGAEKHKSVRLEIRHQAATGLPAAFSKWPPNS